MKKLRTPLVLAFLFIVFISCTKDNVESSDDYKLITKSIEFTYNDYKNQVTNEIDVIYSSFDDYDGELTDGDEEKADYILDYLTSNSSDQIGYVDSSFFDNMKSIEPNDPEIPQLSELGLSSETLYYFEELENLNNIQDYRGLITLKNQYKNNFDSDPDLASLATAFSVIEYYEEDLLILNERGCQIDGGAVASSAVTGAITGARVGFLIGSWLGPKGSAAGAIGGAIAGAVYASYVSIGVQGIGCELQN